MQQRLTYCLALLTIIFCCLTPTKARAQVLRGTFAAGTNHSLSIHADGTLWATGGNGAGQLGDGTTTLRTAWVQIGTATNWVQVAAGNFYSLGLRTDGTLWAWGINQYGQLGSSLNNNTSTANPTPTQVPGTYTQLAASWEHSLALRADGSLWAWGLNYHGQLGRSTNVNTNVANPVPTQVPGTYTQVGAGSDYSLALRADGSLWSWGNNYFGQLGTANNPGVNTANPVPTQVAGTYTSLTAGSYHALALRADGSLWAWGNNNFGSLGNATNNGSNAANAVPTQVAGTYTSAAAGFYHSLALRADGSLWAWGLNDYGQLGNGTSTTSAVANPVPTQVPGTYVQAELGFHFTLALQASGSLLTCGDNGQGQLGTATGLGTNNPNPTPTATGTALPTRSTAASVSAGFAIKADGTLWAWGTNTNGLLGSAITPDRTRPGQVGTDRDWVQVVSGQLHALALKANGTAWAWGNNANGELGQGNTASAATLVQVPLPTPVVQLAAGGTHSLALTASGMVYGWGRNTYGEVGQPAAAAVVSPAALASSLAFVQLAGGTGHSLARTATGQAYAWGVNQFGQLGTATNAGATVANAVPLPVTGLAAVRQLAAGSVHSLAIAATGQAYAWGNNAFGQLGASISGGSNAVVSQPTLVAGLPLATQLAGGRFHSMALGEGGTVYSWGNNATGQLGQGTTTATPTFQLAQEATGSTAWATLGTGIDNGYSLVRTASGLTFASAGRNEAGQLGDGTTTDWPRFDRLSPLTSLQALPVLAGAAGVAFALFPNPARTQATAVGLPTGSTLAVYDALGRRVLVATGFTFSVAGLPAGVYVVRAIAPGQAAQTARLVVE